MNESDPCIVLFDVVCSLCNSAVSFIIRRDPHGAFRFASLQSEAGRRLLSQYPELHNADSVILLAKGKPYSESSAALRIARRLQGPWKLAAALLLVPKPVRDAAYRYIAKRRYRWFGKRDACLIPTAEMKGRLLSDG